MNETKHTPGPWEIRHTGNQAKDISIFRVGAAPSSGCIAKVPHRDGRGAIQAADAAMIAAAPELLDFALAFVANLKEREDDGDIIFGDEKPLLDQARAAIAKATGGAS